MKIKKLLSFLLLLININLFAQKGLVGTSNSPYAKLYSLGMDDVKLTDGFWADLDPDLQRTFVEGRFSANEAERDDRSLLSISRDAANTAPGISRTHATANIYVRTATS